MKGKNTTSSPTTTTTKKERAKKRNAENNEVKNLNHQHNTTTTAAATVEWTKEYFSSTHRTRSNRDGMQTHEQMSERTEQILAHSKETMETLFYFRYLFLRRIINNVAIFVAIVQHVYTQWFWWVVQSLLKNWFFFGIWNSQLRNFKVELGSLSKSIKIYE